MVYILDETSLICGWFHESSTADIPVGYSTVLLNTNEYATIEKNFIMKNDIVIEIPKKPGHGYKWDGTVWVNTRTAPSTQDKRAVDYPDIKEQLDMLYHAMDSGEIPKATQWYNTIKQIKDKHPKE